MSLQNRVDPGGRFHAVSAHGTLIGNRGVLHNEPKQIVAPWRSEAWLTCKIDFQGIRRKQFGSGTYPELFFINEATAFAAGHRPCAACRLEQIEHVHPAGDQLAPVSKFMKSGCRCGTAAECQRVVKGERQVTVRWPPR